MTAMQGLRQEHVAHESAPVTPEDFAAAAERTQAALDRYIEAAAQRQYAEVALRALQCRATFTYTVEGPLDDDDIYVIEGECLLQSGHAPDDHAENYSAAKESSPAYAAAHRRFLDACSTAGELHQRWEDAAEALEALRCALTRPGAWPCVSRRGHLDDHDHPTTMQLVL